MEDLHVWLALQSFANDSLKGEQKKPSCVKVYAKLQLREVS